MAHSSSCSAASSYYSPNPQPAFVLRTAYRSLMSSAASLTSPTSPTSPASLVPPLSPGDPSHLLTVSTSSPPVSPAAWLWSCHHCHSTYPLGVTRRCLNDGHVFCAGATKDKETGRVRRHQACYSQFDYGGWQARAAWRRRVLEAKGNRSRDPGLALSSHNCCHDCNFPSECRWQARQTQQSLALTSSPDMEDSTEDPTDNPATIEEEEPVPLLFPASEPDADASDSSSEHLLLGDVSLEDSSSEEDEGEQSKPCLTSATSPRKTTPDATFLILADDGNTVEAEIESYWLHGEFVGSEEANDTQQFGQSIWEWNETEG